MMARKEDVIELMQYGQHPMELFIARLTKRYIDLVLIPLWFVEEKSTESTYIGHLSCRDFQ